MSAILPFGEISEDSELNGCIYIHASMTEQTQQLQVKHENTIILYMRTVIHAIRLFQASPNASEVIQEARATNYLCLSWSRKDLTLPKYRV